MAGLIQLGVPRSAAAAAARPRTAGLNVLMVLPALTEATGPLWRPIKYALFPPLGLAQHAAYAAGWKKFEPAWNLLIRAKRVALARPALEGVLARVTRESADRERFGAKTATVRGSAG